MAFQTFDDVHVTGSATPKTESQNITSANQPQDKGPDYLKASSRSCVSEFHSSVVGLESKTSHTQIQKRSLS